MAQPEDETQFTLASAARIARVVRIVENAVPQAKPLQFDPVLQSPSRVLRLGYYSGSWQAGQTMGVTIHGGESTVTAQNLTFYLPVAGNYTARDCIIGKVAGEWHLVSAYEDHVVPGTFTGSWTKGETATVTLAGGYQIVANNRFADISGGGGGNCSVARVGMGWDLIAAECP